MRIAAYVLAVLVVAVIVGPLLYGYMSPKVIAPAEDRGAADPEVVQQARATADRFVEAVQNRSPEDSAFAVRMRAETEEGAEQVWLHKLSVVNGALRGAIRDYPALAGLQRGQIKMVAPEQVTDWMYVSGGELRGGYSLKAELREMSNEERAEFLRTAPFDLELDD